MSSEPQPAREIALYDVRGRRLWKPATRGELPFVVISVPKSGTYMVARLLVALGLVDAEIHTDGEIIGDTRGRPVSAKRGDGAATRWSMTLPETAARTGPGQFFVGHLHRTPEAEACLEGFAKLFCVRELRACMVSFLRFFCAPHAFTDLDEPWRALEPGPAQMLGFLQGTGGRILSGDMAAVAPWMQHPAVLPVRYETLMGDDGPAARTELLRRLAALAGFEGDPDAVFDTQVVGQETRTSSGERSRVEDYWSDEVEAAFAALGGAELNRRLGY